VCGVVSYCVSCFVWLFLVFYRVIDVFIRNVFFCLVWSIFVAVVVFPDFLLSLAEYAPGLETSFITSSGVWSVGFLRFCQGFPRWLLAKGVFS